MKLFYALLVTFLFLSCSGKENPKNTEMYLVKNLIGKKIILPKELSFISSYTNDSVVCIPQSNYKIVTYVDSIGCLSCKLGLKGWKNLIKDFDAMNINVPILFYIHPLDARTLKATLLHEDFEYPICIDRNNIFSKRNKIPNDQNVNTFLINQADEIVAIGNPIQNINIKRLYMKIIQGQTILRDKYIPNTQIEIFEKNIDLGIFSWLEKRIAIFKIKNIGLEKLELFNVVSSCSCTTVEYPSNPIPPGETAVLKVIYEAERPEPFLREIAVYCNTPSSPLQLEISGEAK